MAAIETKFLVEQKISSHCRFCAEEMNQDELINLNVENTFGKYKKMLSFLKLDVDLSDVQMPKYACLQCHNKLLEIFNFFLIINSSQDALSLLYNDDKSVIFNSDTVDPKDSALTIEESEIEDVKYDIEQSTQVKEIENSSHSDSDQNIVQNNERTDFLCLEMKELYSEKSNFSNNATIESQMETVLINNTNESNNGSLTYFVLPLKYLNQIDGINIQKYIQWRNIQSPCHSKEENEVLNPKNYSNKSISDVTENSLSNPNDNTSKLDDTTSEGNFQNDTDILNICNLTSLFTDKEKIVESFQIHEENVNSNKSIEGEDATEICWNNNTNNENSWATYPWSCEYCKENCSTMEDLRDHSKYIHDRCYGFSCADCTCDFNTFNTFVEHVRMHRECLRLFCQYCNVKFEDRTACHEHSLTHWHSHHICDHCGQSFLDQIALISHKKMFKRRVLKRRTKSRKPKLVLEDSELSWKEYEWTCLDCFKLLPDIHSLRHHMREVHNKCFATKCADCLLVRLDFKVFVGHVREHRPYLKDFCQYCNQHFPDPEDLEAHIDKHLSHDKICYGCGDIFDSTESLRQHILDYDAPTRYKFLTDEDVTCNICYKFCKSIPKLKSHKLTHNPEQNNSEYICDKCGKILKNTNSYRSHLQSHENKSEICKICSNTFRSKFALRAHAKTHLIDKPFACNECGKCFKTKGRVAGHLKCHSNIKRYACVVCRKRFRENSGLKTHSAQHTGLRLQCSQCDKTFTNHPNLNKHMKRRHKTTFYKSKMTPLGKVGVDERGEPRNILMDETKKEWLSEVMRKKVGGRRKTPAVGD